MLPYKYILLLLSVTIISIQQATAKKDEESKQVDRQFMTWSPTIAPPPNTPFPTYNSNNGDGLIPINSLSLPPIIPILPPEQCSPNLPCSTELQQCTDGTTESCCGNTYESFICNCEISLESGELQWMCYYTDYCFLPSCDDGDDGGVGVAIDDGEVSDALQSTLPVETDAPVSTPVTVEPTTANPTTVKPTTSNPTTSKPTTSSPTTAIPTEPVIFESTQEGEPSGGFLSLDGSPTTPWPTDNGGGMTIATTDDNFMLLELPNCYVYSSSEADCTSNQNCEYTKDSSNQNVCTNKRTIASNCYTLSTSQMECTLAQNCLWTTDDFGTSVCKLDPYYSASPTPNPSSCGAKSTKEICKLDTKCIWDKQTTKCADAPYISPCYNATKEYCNSDTDCLWDKHKNDCQCLTNCEQVNVPPEAPGSSVCIDLSKDACKLDNNNCVWDKQLQLCRGGTSNPTSSSTRRPIVIDTPFPTMKFIDTPRPSLDPTLEPTISPTDLPTPSPFTPNPTDEPTRSPIDLTPFPQSARPTTKLPSFLPTASPVDIGQLPVNEETGEEVEFGMTQIVNCTALEKEDCKLGAGQFTCEWGNKGCISVSSTPTVSPSTAKPTFLTVNCTDPNILQEICKANPTCFWDKYTKICSDYVSDRPTRTPTTSKPSMSPIVGTKSPVTDAPTTSNKPSLSPTLNPTVSHKPTISPAPTDSPTVSFYPTLDITNTRTKLNTTRFLQWDSLPREVQVAAKDELRYTKQTWDNIGGNGIEYLRYNDLSDAQKEAAKVIGFDNEISWNCWQNHWESFSWKQLASRGLTKHLSSLGWGSDSWNAQYSSSPQIRRVTKWDDLTDQQREDAMELCYYKTSWERLDLPTWGYGFPLAKPANRFVEWNDLNETDKIQLEGFLGYDNFTWNVLRLDETEQKGWFELVYYEKDVAASVLGLNEKSWDCWINHYDSYSWNDLVKRGIDTFWRGLGYTEESWNEEIEAPASEGKTWDELTEEEKTHATELCFNRDTWDQIDMATNPGPFPFPKPVIRYTPWNQLTDEQRRVAQILLYTPETWNDMGLADIEKRAWDDLTEYQRPYATQLWMYSRTWNCFQNHYRATKWGELSDEVVRAAKTIGWDEQRWLYGNEPGSYIRSWGSLSPEEKEAAYVMCHHDVTWPGDGKSVNLINQDDYKDNLVSGAHQVVGSISLLIPVVVAVLVVAIF